MGFDQAPPRVSRGGTATASGSSCSSDARLLRAPPRARLEAFHPRPGPRADQADGRRVDLQSLQLEYKSCDPATRDLSPRDLSHRRATRRGSRS
jgi:hypothetical protein